jgi:hypothetical protein
LDQVFDNRGRVRPDYNILQEKWHIVHEGKGEVKWEVTAKHVVSAMRSLFPAVYYAN